MKLDTQRTDTKYGKACCAECHKKAVYTDCCYAECRYAECHYAKCRGALKLPCISEATLPPRVHVSSHSSIRLK
jgi:hypothetical protein